MERLSFSAQQHRCHGGAALLCRRIMDKVGKKPPSTAPKSRRGRRSSASASAGSDTSAQSVTLTDLPRHARGGGSAESTPSQGSVTVVDHSTEPSLSLPPAKGKRASFLRPLLAPSLITSRAARPQPLRPQVSTDWQPPTAELVSTQAPRLRGVHLPAPRDDSPRPSLPSDALGRLIGTLQAAHSAHASGELNELCERALTLFLTEPTSMQAVYALHQQSEQALRSLGLSAFAERCKKAMARALRDPAPVLQQAMAAVAEERATLPPPLQIAANGWLREMQKTMRSLPAFAAAPVASMAAGAHCLTWCLQEVREHRQVPADATVILEDQAASLSDKQAALKRLSGATTSDVAARAIVDAARWRLADASAAARLVKTFLRLPSQPQMMLVPGLSMDELARRAIAVSELRRYAEHLSAPQLVTLQRAISARQVERSAYGTLPAAANIERHLRALSENDFRMIAMFGADGRALDNVFALWEAALTLPSGRPFPSAERFRLKAALRSELAQAPLDAKAIVQQTDVLRPLFDRLLTLRAQLQVAPAQGQDAFYQRAFESLLVTRLIDNCPPSTLQTWSQMGEALAAYIFDRSHWPTDRAVRQQVSLHLRTFLQQRGARPWDSYVPEMGVLLQVANDPSFLDEVIFASTVELVAAPAGNGTDVLVKAHLLPEIWSALASAKEAMHLAPVREQVEQDVAAVMLRSVQPPLSVQRAATGVMAYHQPLPEEHRALVAPHAASGPTSAPFPPEHLAPAEHYRVSGPSRTAVVLTHLFDWARSQPGTSLTSKDHRDALLGSLMSLVHDGMHSSREVMWSADRAMDQRYASADGELPEQSLAHLRNLFADEAAVASAFSRSAASLARFDAELQRVDGKR